MKLYRYLIIILLSNLFTFYQDANAQAPDWAWAKSAGGPNYDQGLSCATDASGNVYFTGTFDSPNISFGNFSLTNSNAGFPDIFIVKYDSSGNVLWAKSEGGSDGDYSHSIATDANGNVFITGNFYSTTISFGATTLYNFNYADIFIVKYDSSGNVIWAKGAGGYYYDYGICLATDLNGNVFITGYFSSSNITFGAFTLTNVGPTAYKDIFTVKYDSNGNALWAKGAGGTSQDYVNSVATDASGNVFITGSFYSSVITFGTDVITNTHADSADIYITKYDSGGNVIWTKGSGGTSNDDGLSVATDVNGNLFVAGSFMSSTIAFGNTTLINAGIKDIFIVKFDAGGNELWAKREGGTNNDGAFCVATDANGNAFLSGGFKSAIINFGSSTLTNNGGVDIFIAKYNSSGIIIWAKSAGGTNGDFAYSTTTDLVGNVFISGWFWSQDITFGTTTLVNGGNSMSPYDIFIAKLDTSITTALPELQPSESFTIAPNPFTTQTVITFSQEQTNTNIRIMDMLGKEIKAMNFNGKQFILQKESMQPGIYFLQAIEEKNNVVNRKFVIQ